MIAPLEYASKICYSTIETLKFSYMMGAKFNQTNFCFVECGTAAGAQVIAMRAGAPDNTIHVFDSFSGIPLPSNRDDQMPGLKYLTQHEILNLPDPGKQELITTGATSVSVDSFKEHLVNSGVGLDKIIIHEGWFEDTVAKSDTGPIAILRLDGDLYNSTLVCLQHLFERVIPGGCVILDDINLKGCKDACKDYFDSIHWEPDYKFISTIAYFYK